MDKKIIIIDDVYTQEEIENNEASIINDAKWEYSAVSDEDTYGAESSIFFISNKVNSLLQQKIISDFLLSAYIQHSISMPKDKQSEDRVYLNGQTYGLDGQWHMDIDSPNYYTLLYMVNTGDVSNICDFQYINPSNKDVEETIPFKSGRFVLFPSDWKHRGLGPTVKNKMRVTLAYKTLKFK